MKLIASFHCQDAEQLAHCGGFQVTQKRAFETVGQITSIAVPDFGITYTVIAPQKGGRLVQKK